MSQPRAQPKPKLLDRVRHEIRTRHYSRRTTKAYIHWVKRCVFIDGKRHPLPPPFVTHLLEDGHHIGTVEELLCRSDVSATIIYTRVLNRSWEAVRSPADRLGVAVAPMPLAIPAHGRRVVAAIPTATRR